MKGTTKSEGGGDGTTAVAPNGSQKTLNEDQGTSEKSSLRQNDRESVRSGRSNYSQQSNVSQKLKNLKDGVFKEVKDRLNSSSSGEEEDEGVDRFIPGD